MSLPLDSSYGLESECRSNMDCEEVIRESQI